MTDDGARQRLEQLVQLNVSVAAQPAGPGPRDEFRRGLGAALDPETEAAMAHEGRALTTKDSWWVHTICADPACKHTFRKGDEVLLDGEGQVRHCSALLPCAGELTESADQSEALTQFYAGMNAAWPPPADLRVERLGVDHCLVRLHPGFPRRTCFVCGHTLRPNDQVIVCPCHQPECQVAIHRDPEHGMNCLDVWRPDQKTSSCPATSKVVHG